jgi:hypothetical protein
MYMLYFCLGVWKDQDAQEEGVNWALLKINC